MRNQTTEADGDITSFSLPGGIQTSISGIGVFCPNGDQTQRVGVKIDYLLKEVL